MKADVSDAAQYATLAAQRFVRSGVSMLNDTVRLVVVDERLMMREGLCLVLAAAPDIAVVGDAGDNKRGIAVTRETAPHVVVLNLKQSDHAGLSALREFRAEVPETQVLVLSSDHERGQLLSLLEAGARGCVPETDSADDLLDAVRVVASGKVFVTAESARYLAAALAKKSAANDAKGRLASLSPRERSILGRIATGYSGVEIARQLGISNRTVDVYKHRIRDKIGLSHRTEYVSFACEAGVLAHQSAQSDPTVATEGHESN